MNSLKKYEKIIRESLDLEDEFDLMFEITDILSFKMYKQGIEILEKYGVSF